MLVTRAVSGFAATGSVGDTGGDRISIKTRGKSHASNLPSKGKLTKFSLRFCRIAHPHDAVYDDSYYLH